MYNELILTKGSIEDKKMELECYISQLLDFYSENFNEIEQFRIVEEYYKEWKKALKAQGYTIE